MSMFTHDFVMSSMNLCKNMVHEVQVISHSCGVSRPRLMGRKHIRIVQDNSKSIPMDQLYPRPDIFPKYKDIAASLAPKPEKKSGGYCG